MPVSSDNHWGLSDELYASPGTRGSYNPLHFVVRLRPEFFAALESSRDDFLVASDPSQYDLASAFSTFFHETIHWWQHIGSTTGFMLSMAYPAATHLNRPHLLKLLQEIGPVKSLLKIHETNKPGMSAVATRSLNAVLNNWHDVEFNRRIILDPTPKKLEKVINSPYFASVGHSLYMGLSHTLWLLLSTVDPEARLLPDIRRWEEGFAKLRAAKHAGYAPGSPAPLAPVGALHIFEGQARFNQLQYLHLASNGAVGWDEFKAQGMFGGVYITAFERFLEWTGAARPATPLHPIVALFLLVCDLAINPSDGLPFDIGHFESFHESNNPGVRFFIMARHIAKNPALLNSLSKLTAEEYLEVSTALCKSLVCKNPVEMGRRVLEWVEKSDTLKALLEEERTYAFKNVNFPVRVCFAKYLRFTEDRVKRPEFFCWPAMHFVEGGSTKGDLPASKALFDRHKPMFLANLEGEIRPALTGQRDEAAIMETFNTFFNVNIVYDMAEQWIIDAGPFNYDYSWLTDTFTPDRIKPFADDQFKNLFGVEPDSFRHA